MTSHAQIQRLGEWTPKADAPVFAGHFPGNPLLPGAVLIDWAIDVFNRRMGWSADHGSIRQAKFPSPARPGVPLTLTYQPAPRGRGRLTVTSHAADAETCTVLELLVDAAPTTQTGAA